MKEEYGRGMKVRKGRELADVKEGRYGRGGKVEK